jgi:hypothetical protein
LRNKKADKETARKIALRRRDGRFSFLCWGVQKKGIAAKAQEEERGERIRGRLSSRYTIRAKQLEQGDR